jgi:hypothetical protein
LHDFDRVLAQVCQELVLEHESGDGSAEGTIGGLSIDVSLDEEDDGDIVQVSIHVPNQETLWLKRRGVPLLSGKAAGKHPFVLGDPSFDHAIELGSVPLALQQALRRDAELRAWLLHVVVRLGAVFEASQLTWMGPPPRSGQELRALLESVLELARRLNAPLAVHRLPAVGTAIAAWLRSTSSAPEDARRHQLTQFLDRVGLQLGSGQAYFNAHEHENHWQGTTSGCPIRIVVDSEWWVRIELRTSAAPVEIRLEYQPEMAPLVGAPPPWQDEKDGPTRIFVGPGIFVRDFASSIAAAAESFERLHPAAKAHVIEAMRRDGIASLRLSKDLEASFDVEIGNMLDPEGQIARAALLAGWLAPQLSGLPPMDLQAAGGAGARASDTVTCRFCSTLFLLQRHSVCPNCGAAPQG